ncbi:MAG: hypothetical protein PHX89_03580 [bacterium]|nr:hypothetical protein [bacterium]MDD3805686.1 hypothetical protein [bacterium]MDD4558013.1 hypothetical protein [bacterium]
MAEEREGKVTWCSAVDCGYNEDMKCIADGVAINMHVDHADCETYTENTHI